MKVKMGLYDDRKTLKTFTVTITFPAELWDIRKKLMDLIGKVLKGATA